MCSSDLIIKVKGCPVWAALPFRMSRCRQPTCRSPVFWLSKTTTRSMVRLRSFWEAALPKLNGFEILNRLRKTHQTPVMMLTACGAEEERITGYSRGADDYVPKPFNFTELVLRIEALLRRSRGSHDTRSDLDTMEVGKLRLDRTSLSVVYGDVDVSLTQIQFRLLWVLVLHQGEALSKPYLYQVVLEKEFSRYDRSLDMHLSRVRRKLVNAGMAADRLQTVHGKGYCFL